MRTLIERAINWAVEHDGDDNEGYALWGCNDFNPNGFTDWELKFTQTLTQWSLGPTLCVDENFELSMVWFNLSLGPWHLTIMRSREKK